MPVEVLPSNIDEAEVSKKAKTKKDKAKANVAKVSLANTQSKRAGLKLINSTENITYILPLQIFRGAC